jgi:tetratricopeptide (TPR) repeat protein
MQILGTPSNYLTLKDKSQAKIIGTCLVFTHLWCPAAFLYFLMPSFLTTHQSDANPFKSPQLIVIFFMAAFAALWISMLADAVQGTTYIFDRETPGCLTICQKSLLRTKTTRYPLESVLGIEKCDDHGFQIVLETEKRRLLFVNRGEKVKQETVETVARWLGFNINEFGGLSNQKHEEFAWSETQKEIRYWEDIVQNSPDNANAWMRLGIVLYHYDKIKNRAKAIAYLKKSEILFKKQGCKLEAQSAYAHRVYILPGGAWEIDQIVPIDDNRLLKISGGSLFRILEFNTANLTVRQAFPAVCSPQNSLATAVVSFLFLGAFLRAFFIPFLSFLIPSFGFFVGVIKVLILFVVPTLVLHLRFLRSSKYLNSNNHIQDSFRVFWSFNRVNDTFDIKYMKNWSGLYRSIVKSYRFHEISGIKSQTSELDSAKFVLRCQV